MSTVIKTGFTARLEVKTSECEHSSQQRPCSENSPFCSLEWAPPQEPAPGESPPSNGPGFLSPACAIWNSQLGTVRPWNPLELKTYKTKPWGLVSFLQAPRSIGREYPQSKECYQRPERCRNENEWRDYWRLLHDSLARPSSETPSVPL